MIYSTKKYINSIKIAIKKEQKNNFIRKHKTRISLSPYRIQNTVYKGDWYFSYGSYKHISLDKNPRDYLVTFTILKEKEYTFILTGNSIGIAIGGILIYASKLLTPEDYFHISLEHDLFFSYDEIIEIKKSLKGIKNKLYRIYFVPFIRATLYNEYKLYEHYTHS